HLLDRLGPLPRSVTFVVQDQRLWLFNASQRNFFECLFGHLRSFWLWGLLFVSWLLFLNNTMAASISAMIIVLPEPVQSVHNIYWSHTHLGKLRRDVA